MERAGTEGLKTLALTDHDTVAGLARAREAAEREAEEAEPRLLAEFWDFLLHNKKWWLTPIILVLLLAALLAIWGGSAAAPFIYPGL